MWCGRTCLSAQRMIGLVFLLLCVALCGIAAAQAPEAVEKASPAAEPAKGPVVLYHFDEGEGQLARNAVADGKDGAIHDATYVKAGDGFALHFNGDNNYVTLPDKTANISGENLSIECWFRVADPEATWRGLCGDYHSGTAGYMLVYTGSAAFYNGLQSKAVSSGKSLSDRKWHHVAGVLDKGTMRMYVDGVAEESVQTGQSVVASTYPFEIGRYGFGKSFNGEIDEVAVYDRPLTADEIKAHYEEGKR